MAVGPRAPAPPLSERRGASIESARDAVIVLSLLALVLPAPVETTAAPVRADTVLVLPEIRVERPRVAEARRRLPTASVSELEAGASGRALETISELLGATPGARVQQYGGLGAFATVSLRGAPPGQVAVFLDGAPLTSAAHGVVSLGDLPATAVERIEVYRGLSPLGLGMAAPGGAINLVTTSSPEVRAGRIARGAFGTWEARGSAGARRGALSGFVHAGHQRSQGDFRYPDDNGTPFNPEDDSLGTRVNNRFEATTLLASLVWRPGGGWRVAGREDLFRKAQGVPGLGAVPAYATHLAFTRALSGLEVSRAGAGAVPGVRLSAGRARERTRFRDSAAELGLGRHDTDDRVSGESAGLALEWARLPHGIDLGATGSLRAERARPADAADGYPDPPPSRRAAVGAGTSLQWRPLGERLVVHAATRRDGLRDRIRWVEVGGLVEARTVRRTLDAPQLGVRASWPRRLELRANWADARRAPDFLELFGNQGSVLGNPGLLPERARNWDVGVSWSRTRPNGRSATVDLAHFETRAEDLVVYVRRSQSSVRAENIARARIRGEELSARLGPWSGAALTVGVTRMFTRDDGPVPFWNGRRLPLRPAQEGFARLDWRRGGFRVVTDLQYIGDDYLDRANLQRAPDRLLAGASLSFSPHAGALRLTVEGKNLGDDRASDVGGFPLPGRALFAACEVRLGAAGDRTR